MNKFKQTIALLFLCLLSVNAYSLEKFNSDNIRGFLNVQSINTSGIDFSYYGGVNLGLNLNYTILDRVYLSTQINFQNLVEKDFNSFESSELNLEYLLANILLYNTENTQHNLLLGRVKIPYGFYNQTRDVPFTLPTPFMPQFMYSEVLRKSTSAADGGIYKFQYFKNKNSFGMDLGYGKNQIDDDFTRFFYPIFYPLVELETDNSKILNLSLDLDSYKYRFNFSYLSTKVNSTTIPTGIDFRATVTSFQYNTNKFSWTNEYNVANVDIENGFKTKTVGFYTQLEYFLNRKFTFLIRYEDVDFEQENPFFPNLEYKGYIFNTKYYMTKDISLNLFYSKNKGINTLIPIDLDSVNDPSFDLDGKWDLFMVSFDYRF
jgi:hypothetical protein